MSFMTTEQLVPPPYAVRDGQLWTLKPRRQRVLCPYPVYVVSAKRNKFTLWVLNGDVEYTRSLFLADLLGTKLEYNHMLYLAGLYEDVVVRTGEHPEFRRYLRACVAARMRDPA